MCFLQGQLGLGDNRDRLVPTQITAVSLETGHGRMAAVRFSDYLYFLTY